MRRSLTLWVAIGGLALAAAPASAAGEASPQKLQEAAAALQRGQAPAAIELLTSALADSALTNDKRATILVDRAVAYGRNGQIKAALDDYNRAAQLYPEYPALYNNRGVLLIQLGLNAEAVKDFDRAVLLSPAYGAAYANRGNAHLQLRAADEALKDFGRAVELMPTNAPAYYGRGRALLAKDRLTFAIRDFSRAVVLDARFSPGYRARAEARIMLGAEDEAVEDLSRAIAFAPNTVELYLLRGKAHLAADNVTAALKDFTQATGLAPDSAAALEARGFGHAKAEAFDEALNDLARAMELAPRSALAYAYRAWTYKQMGQPDLGLRDIERALKLDPNAPEVLWARSQLREVPAQAEEAIADLRKALDIRPDYRDARLALEALGVTDGGDAEVVDLALDPWRVFRRGRLLYAAHGELPRLRVPLEMLGEGQLRLIEWDVKTPTKGFGVLRYASGSIVSASGTAEESECIAVVDLGARRVLLTEIARIGAAQAKLEWLPGRLGVTTVKGQNEDVVLKGGAAMAAAEDEAKAAPVAAAPRRPAPVDRPAAPKYSGPPSWAPWAQGPGYQPPPRPQHKPKGKSFFDMLFNN